jgi:hypothetical protein
VDAHRRRARSLSRAAHKRFATPEEIGQVIASDLTSPFTGTDAITKIVDHSTLRDGKAISLWFAYFEPQAVLEKLGIKHCLGR